MEETFTLKEIKEKVEIADSKSWKPFLKGGIEELEVEAIEKYLPSSATKEDIKHDFTFYTPSCRDVRVKVFDYLALLLDKLLQEGLLGAGEGRAGGGTRAAFIL